MKTLKAILSKGPDDFGAWFENIEACMVQVRQSLKQRRI
jgi:hypothetical protein